MAISASASARRPSVTREFGARQDRLRASVPSCGVKRARAGLRGEEIHHPRGPARSPCGGAGQSQRLRGRRRGSRPASRPASARRPAWGPRAAVGRVGQGCKFGLKARLPVAAAARRRSRATARSAAAAASAAAARGRLPRPRPRQAGRRLRPLRRVARSACGWAASRRSSSASLAASAAVEASPPAGIASIAAGAGPGLAGRTGRRLRCRGLLQRGDPGFKAGQGVLQACQVGRRFGRRRPIPAHPAGRTSGGQARQNWSGAASPKTLKCDRPKPPSAASAPPRSGPKTPDRAAQAAAGAGLEAAARGRPRLAAGSADGFDEGAVGRSRRPSRGSDGSA